MDEFFKQIHEQIEKLKSEARAKARENWESWFRDRSAEDTLLWQKAAEFERLYFEDMTKEFPRDLATLNIEGDEIPFPDYHISVLDWIITYEEFSGGLNGACTREAKKIALRPGLKEEEDSVLLHEMIHAYEYCLMEPHRQYVTLRLSDEFKSERPKIMKYVALALHKEFPLVDHPDHTPLFALKSMDLDKQRGEDYGTIFGYGLEEIVSEYEREQK